MKERPIPFSAPMVRATLMDAGGVGCSVMSAAGKFKLGLISLTTRSFERAHAAQRQQALYTPIENALWARQRLVGKSLRLIPRALRSVDHQLHGSHISQTAQQHGVYAFESHFHLYQSEPTV